MISLHPSSPPFSPFPSPSPPGAIFATHTNSPTPIPSPKIQYLPHALPDWCPKKIILLLAIQNLKTQMSCFKTLKLLFVTGSPSLGGRGVAPTIFDVAAEDGAGEGCGVGVIAGEIGGGEGGGVVLIYGSVDGVYGWQEICLTASSVSSCASGMAEACAVPLMPLTFVLDIGSTAAAARANGVGISVVDMFTALHYSSNRCKTRTINRGEKRQREDRRRDKDNIKSAATERAQAAPSF